jgi:hypothetical protein
MSFLVAAPTLFPVLTPREQAICLCGRIFLLAVGVSPFLRAESIHTWGIFEHRALPGTTARLPALMVFLKEE